MPAVLCGTHLGCPEPAWTDLVTQVRMLILCLMESSNIDVRLVCQL
jgi:hypothetical protein